MGFTKSMQDNRSSIEERRSKEHGGHVDNAREIEPNIFPEYGHGYLQNVNHAGR